MSQQDDDGCCDCNMRDEDCRHADNEACMLGFMAEETHADDCPHTAADGSGAEEHFLTDAAHTLFGPGFIGTHLTKGYEVDDAQVNGQNFQEHSNTSLER